VCIYPPKFETGYAFRTVHQQWPFKGEGCAMNKIVPSGEHRAHDDPTIQRLEDQIQWYDQRSNRNQRTFKLLKIIMIVAAALIPLLVGLPVPAWATGALGVVIAVTEGIQQLNQYHANWISYRSTCEALKHEKFLVAVLGASSYTWAEATWTQGLTEPHIAAIAWRGRTFTTGRRLNSAAIHGSVPISSKAKSSR
jgi:hypothetical protein